MIYLESQDRDGIRAASNYLLFRDELLEFDYKRFRGLGEKNTSNFISHVVKTCDNFNLYEYNSVLQVMKSMCFLGSNMLEDPRYTHITKTLSIPTDCGEYRVKNFNLEVSNTLSFLAGAKLNNYQNIIRASIEAIDGGMTPNEAQHHISMAIPTDIIVSIKNWRNPLLHAAEEAMSELRIHGDHARLFCLMSSAILGYKFYNDPLYPWVNEFFSRDPDPLPQARLNDVIKYSSKRMKKQLKEMEDYYGV